MNNWVLSFALGEFRLQTDIATLTDSRASHLLSCGWSRVSATDPTNYKSKSPRAAVVFKPFADEKAQKLLKRLFISFKEAPHGRRILVPPDRKLMPHQIEGARFALSRSRSYIAHDPGLGKTALAIAVSNHLNGPICIISPPFLRLTWAREIMDWAIEDFPDVRLINSQAFPECDWNDADFVIISDTAIGKTGVREAFANTKWKGLFVDEAHRYKEESAQRTLNLFGGEKRVGTKKIKVPSYIHNAEHVVFLSGTPRPNARSMELWPVLSAAAPEAIDFLKYDDYGFKYCGGRTDEEGRYVFDSATHDGELKKRITEHFMHRVRKVDVLKDLPAKVRKIIYTDQRALGPAFAEFERQALRDFDSEKAYGRADNVGALAKWRKATGLAKVKWAQDYIRYRLENSDESIIVYAHHREVIAKLTQSLAQFSPLVIRGGTSESTRANYQDLFQAKTNRIIVANIDAIKLGLTLTAATRGIFVEYAWGFDDNCQAEDRMHRKGQHDSVYCEYLVMPGGFDERMLKTVFRKQKSNEKMLG